jgi:uncharacterized protein DUF5076
MKPLGPPEDAPAAEEAVEVLRGWIVDGDLQLSIAFEAFGRHVETWGQLLAETVGHLADAMSVRGYGEREAIFGRILSSLLDNLECPRPGLHGSVQDPVQ